MKRTYIIVPTLVLGALVAVGTTASAFYPGTFSLAAFSSFTESQQAAIEEAHNIKLAADAEAEAVLAAAGVDQEALHEAMHEYHDTQREAMDEALADNDYDAFAALVADTPIADELTEEVFAKLVEVHTLRESGDHEAAREIMDALKSELGVEARFGFGPGGRGGPDREPRTDN